VRYTDLGSTSELPVAKLLPFHYSLGLGNAAVMALDGMGIIRRTQAGAVVDLGEGRAESCGKYLACAGLKRGNQRGAEARVFRGVHEIGGSAR
jgi:hypothetical protein